MHHRTVRAGLRRRRRQGRGQRTHSRRAHISGNGPGGALTVSFSLTFHRYLLVRVAGLAETFPSFPVSGPFLPDVPGFKFPSDSVFYRSLDLPLGCLPSHLHFHNCSDVFCFFFSRTRTISTFSFSRLLAESLVHLKCPIVGTGSPVWITENTAVCERAFA